MPKVNGKSYPYTARGVAAAKKAKELAKKRKRSLVGKSAAAAPSRIKK